VICHPRNLGLARSFQAGLKEALSQDADVVVNTDGDHQYRGEDIEALVQPIISGDADMVVGARPIAVINHFSPIKKLLQFVGSLVVRQLSGLKVPDAPSGFRAMSRETALRLIAFGTFTYTIETLIQAGSIGLRVQSVDIGVNPPTRDSRLFKSQSQYVLRAAETILLTYLVYRPTKLFFLLGAVFGLSGIGLSIRYLYFNAIGEGTGHVQSVIIAGALLVAGKRPT
jgi:glycosyltransferase involved in cell wall biosynthesis